MFIEDRRKVFLTPWSDMSSYTTYEIRHNLFVRSVRGDIQLLAELEPRPPVRSINIKSLTGLR